MKDASRRRRGVLGRRVVGRLVTAGFEQDRRRPHPAEASRAGRGRRATVELDLLDRMDVMAAVTGHDVVCNLATAIFRSVRAATTCGVGGKRPHPPGGLRNLIEAAITAGAALLRAGWSPSSMPTVATGSSTRPARSIQQN